jgi:hypothetical protein
LGCWVARKTKETGRGDGPNPDFVNLFRVAFRGGPGNREEKEANESEQDETEIMKK